MLRDPDRFHWATVTLLGFALYVYAVEIERGNWGAVLAGLAFWSVDWINEVVNALVLHFTDRAAIWTATGDTSYQILIGLNVEISLLFLVAGIVFVKQLPAYPAHVDMMNQLRNLTEANAIKWGWSRGLANDLATAGMTQSSGGAS